ncbi:MAG TPA: G5 domain-containing protein [Patescibacteria group bacterium]
MFNRAKKIKISFLIVPIIGGMFFLSMHARGTSAAQKDFDSANKHVTITDSGLSFEAVSGAATVGDFLSQQKISLGEHDVVLPRPDEKLFSGDHVIIQRAKKITIKEGGNTTQAYSLQNTVQDAIWENKKIDLGDDDITKPSRTAPLQDGMVISVTHVKIEDVTVDQDIPFNTVANTDDSLSWRVKKTTQAGVKGIKEITYKVVSYDGKEISRKALSSTIKSQPTDEIVTQGTLVKTGKTTRGLGTWYAFKGGLFAASRDIPRGGYARVTNMDNGKSVIVQINDYGPFGSGRIIDLDKVAFTKIADLGAGVANVKVEVVTN